MFDDVNLEDFKRMKKGKYKLAYIDVFKDMVKKYEMGKGSLTQTKLDIIANELADDFQHLMDGNRKPLDKDTPEEKQKGVDKTTWYQARNGIEAASPWLFAMMCYLSGYDLKERLHAIEIMTENTPEEMGAAIDIFVALWEAHLIKSYTIHGLNGIEFEWIDSKYEKAMRNMLAY